MRMAGSSGGKIPNAGRGFNTRYRTLPLSQILAQREGSVNARYGNGVPVPDGTRLFVPGFNTSGVGPGTPGYMGSWRPGGYNFGEGTRRPSAKTADEYYAQRDEIAGNPLDNLELGNSNLMQSFLKNAMAEARGMGGGTGAGAAPAPAAADPWAGRTTFGQSASTSPAAPTAQAVSGEPDDMQIQQMITDARAQEALDARERLALEMQANQPRTGAGVTSEGSTIDGLPSDLWFQYKAQESVDPNQFASPINPTDETQAWQYSHRLAPFLRRLGIGQSPAFRRPL